MVIYGIIGLLFFIYFMIERVLEDKELSVSISDVFINTAIVVLWPLALILYYLGKVYDVDQPFLIISYKKKDNKED